MAIGNVISRGIPQVFTVVDTLDKDHGETLVLVNVQYIPPSVARAICFS